MGGENSISVEVVHAAEERCFAKWVSLDSGATVADAIGLSGLKKVFPQVEIREDTVGVFSRKVGLAHPLADGDRVEIYRPLTLSPNEIRKLRAERRPNTRRG